MLYVLIAQKPLSPADSMGPTGKHTVRPQRDPRAPCLRQWTPGGGLRLRWLLRAGAG